MERPKVQVKKLHPDAKVPSYAYEGDAGMDIFTVEDYTLQPGERHMFKTGIAMKIPDGYVGLGWDKSGLSQKFGIKGMGGVFDSGYTGEWIWGLVNLSDEPHEFKVGDKIGQALIQEVAHATIEEVDTLPETERGEKKHGSSGK